MKINKKRMMIVLVVLLVVAVVPVHAATCVLGEQTTKDLYGILKIFRIVAPLLLLFFTIFDLVKMLASGMTPAGTEVPAPKLVFQKFGKRLAGVVLLFLVPTFLDLFLTFAGVWDEDGKCDLSNPVNVGETPNAMEGDPRYTAPTTKNAMEGDPRYTAPTTKNAMNGDPRYTAPAS